MSKPAHYDQGNADPLDLMAALNRDGEFAQGSALKYLFRYADKDGISDLAKAAFYIGWMAGLFLGKPVDQRRSMAQVMRETLEELTK
jgi:hypothetical protein